MGKLKTGRSLALVLRSVWLSPAQLWDQEQPLLRALLPSRTTERLQLLFMARKTQPFFPEDNNFLVFPAVRNLRLAEVRSQLSPISLLSHPPWSALCHTGDTHFKSLVLLENRENAAHGTITLHQLEALQSLLVYEELSGCSSTTNLIFSLWLLRVSLRSGFSRCPALHIRGSQSRAVLVACSC